MAPDNPKTGSSSGSAGGMIASEVHDAKRALDMASALNSKTRKAEDKDKKTGLDLEGAAKAVDTVSKDDAVNLLLDGVNSLVDSLPPLVKALEAVAQIHPFVAIAVGAFKVVIELEIKRRDNDKKVNLLFLEMRNMMSVLLQLQSVRANHVARDGITIGARLVDLIKRTANDIKECANVCDTYSKKRLLIKVLKGPIWDDTLKGFIQLFVDHKAEFNFAVAIHTGMAIDRANDKLDTIMTRMESILKFFERCVPPSQRTLNTLVQQAGGPDAASQRPDVLQTLIERERSFEQIPDLVIGDRAQPFHRIPVRTSSVVGMAGSSRTRSHSGFDYSRSAETQRSRRRTRSHTAAESQRASGSKSFYVPTPYATAPARGYDSGRSPSPLRVGDYGDLAEFSREQEIAVLQQELIQAPSTEIKKNLEAFERKFEMQTRELTEEMKRFVVHEGDRVISSVLAGPHERILDPDLYEIWKDMRWRGIVKARHLVLAIHDYYLQKRDDQEHTFQVDGTQHERRRSVDEDDAWTLEYIDLMHVQPIIEALDEDTSGYVTIQEVNQFTTSRPKGWSLLHWMAYWAVGWQVSMTAYRRKILSTLDSMLTLLETVRPPNKVKIRGYLDLTRSLVANIVQAFQGDTERLFLLPRFRAYMNQNEARLQKGLDTMKYQIDALDTLALLNGRRGLERNVFPLLHLLLCRHYDIMKLGRTHVLHMDELIDAQESINIVDDAFNLRRQELSELFDQRRLTVSQELRDFAYGMLSPGYRPMPESNARSDNEDDTYKPNEERPSASILKYPTHQEDFYPVNEDDVHDDEIGGDVDDSLKPILGRWSGVLDPVDDGFGTPLLNLHFHPTAANNNQVIASPKLYFSWMCTRAIVVGECNSTPPGDPMFSFTTTFNTASLQTEYLRMTLSQDGKTLVGYQDIVPDCSSPGRCSVVMKKDIPLELMAFYPSPKLLDTNRPKALWLFATSAVLFQVRRRTITWARIKANRDKRRRFASLTYLHSLQSPLHPENLEELQRLTHRSTWAEIHYGTYAALEPQKFLWILPPCSGGVSGRTCGLLMKAAVPMLRCLSCPPENGYVLTAAFCIDNPNCLRDHLRTGGPIHRIVKTRIHGWSMGEDPDEVENKRLHIINTITDAVARLGGLRYDPPVAEPFSPHRLSTISEISEEVQPEHGEPMSDAAVSSNVLDTLPVPPVHEEARHTFQDDGESQADESTRQKKFGSHPVDAALSPHSDSPSDTTVVEGGVVSVNSLPDVTGNAIQPIVDSKCYCVGCNDEVKMPCWLCIDCPGSRPFVCLACDEKGGITAGDHRSTHTLTRIYEDREDRELYDDFSYEDDEMDDEDRDDSGWEASNKSHLESNTESQLIALGGRLTRMEDRFGAVESKLDRLEGMLETVLSLLRAPQPPIQTVECGVQSAGPP